MFINSKQLVKIMKKAYKGGGLNLGYSEGKLIINTINITLSLDEEATCNTIKAAVVEYLGYIPTEDCYYQVHKDINTPQSKLSEADEILQLLDNYRAAENKAYCTPLIYTGLRIYQTNSGSIFGVSEEYLQIIDKSAIDYGNESEPTGPCYRKRAEYGLYWHNDYCTLVIEPTEIHNEDLLNVLSNLQYHKKDEKKNAAAEE